MRMAQGVAADTPADAGGDTGTPSESIPEDESREKGTKAESSSNAAADFSEFADSAIELLNETFDSFVGPFVSSCSLLRGTWESRGGNYVLRPTGKPKAVVHFIGGAFIGAAPHIGYNSMLQNMARRGYCIVATPFDLGLDYLETAASIATKWEGIETDLALDYGAIPVIGVGHSAGALFHAILSSLFDDVTPKAGNILVSFNNKPIKGAIPLYDEVVRPLARQGVEFESSLPADVLTRLEGLPESINAALVDSPLTPRTVKTSILPVANEARRVVDQLRPLIKELGGVAPQTDTAQSEGTEPRPAREEFYPPPDDIASAMQTMYGVGQTLVLKFTNDAIDESGTAFKCIAECQGGEGVSQVEIKGNHLTPLSPELEPVQSDNTGLGLFPTNAALGVAASIFSAVGPLRDSEMVGLVSVIDEWVETAMKNDAL